MNKSLSLLLRVLTKGEVGWPSESRHNYGRDSGLIPLTAAMITRSATFLAIQILLLISAKTLDNNLIGTPAVSCGPTSLTISAKSSDVFEGQIFIKNHRNIPECLALFKQEANSTNPSFSLPLSQIASCGLEMIRDNEAKSLRLSTVVVFAFHPQFVTSGDRAFAVHCLFQQKDVHVETQFDSIHDLHSTPLNGISIEIPTVEMQILKREDGNSAQKVQVGEPMTLTWRLSQPSQIYGIRILDCFATDSDATQSQIVLEDGCATDDHLLSHVRYSAADDRAFSEVIAFKMPDEEQLFFRCRIAYCIRKTARISAINSLAENSFCQPSKCDEPRQRRETEEPIVIVGRGINVSEALRLESAENSSFDAICISRFGLAISASLSATVYTAAAATGIVLIYKNIRRKRSFFF